MKWWVKTQTCPKCSGLGVGGKGVDKYIQMNGNKCK